MRKLPEEILFDSRLVDRHIRQGLTTRKDYHQWLAKQPDVSDRADYFAIDSDGKAVNTRSESASGERQPS